MNYCIFFVRFYACRLSDVHYRKHSGARHAAFVHSRWTFMRIRQKADGSLYKQKRPKGAPIDGFAGTDQ